MIFLDNNSTCKPCSTAVNYAVEQTFNHYENPSSPYPTKSKELLTEARTAVAEVLSCEPTSIVFTSGGTESNNLALSTSPELGDIIIGTEVEHSSVLGCCLEKIKVNSDGFIDANHLEDVLKKWNTWKPRKIVAVLAANNETGVITDPEQIIPQIVAKYGAHLHIDGIQLFGKQNFTVEQLKADTFSISGHKVGALKGVGALYIKPKYKLHKVWCGGHQEFGWRPGTENQIGIISLGQVSKIIQSNEYQEKLKTTAKNRDLLEDLLSQISERNGSKEHRIPNTSNLYFPEISDADLLVDELYEAGVVVSSRASCLSGMSQPSKVLAAMFGKDNPRVNRSIRFSLSTDTTEEEIKKAAEIIKDTVKKVKGV